MSLILTAAELQEITGRERFDAQRRELDHLRLAYTVAPNGRPIVRREALGTREPEPDAMARERFVVPPLDDGAVYLPMDAIAARRVKYERGTGWPLTGVYFLFHDGELLYIGLSNQVPGRLWSHFIRRVDWPDNAIWFNEAAVIEVPEFWLRRVEAHYIDRERPPRNIKGVDGQCS
jgi:hypothetical protein